MNVGLLFGSFNPIHNGHLAIAEYFEQLDDLDEVWLVVTPVNPFKEDSNLTSDTHRLKMCRLAVQKLNAK